MDARRDRRDVAHPVDTACGQGWAWSPSAQAPARAVYGAWQETLDRISESGIHVGGGMTGGEVSRVAAPIARPYVAELAAQLDRAGYAPEVPDAAAPRLAWANAAVVRTELRRGMHPLRRLLAWVDPRPLWRR